MRHRFPTFPMNGSFTASIFAVQLVHAVLAGAIGWTVVRTLRQIRSLSGVVGTMVAAGILIRILVGLGLFWISYLDVQQFSSLHLGDGFWALMADARGYYGFGVTAVERGIDTINSGSSSPFYVKTLAVWMHIVGISPAVGLYLNLCLYVGVVTILVRAYKPVNEWRRDLPLLVGAGAFSFSPVMLINGTQALKDDLFTALVAIVCVGVLLVLRSLVSPAFRATRRSDLGAGAAVLIVATYCISGIRDYFAVILWAVLALVLALFATRQARRRLLGYGLGAAVVLAGVWAAYALGSGPYYRGPTVAQITRTASGQPRTAPRLGTEVSSLSEASGVVEHARAGFVLAGGATNLAGPATQAEACASCARGLARRAADLAVGLATVFVPISLLKALHIVQFSGGRALLPIADVDTLFLDASLLLILGLLYTRRRVIGDRLPFVVFAIGLSAASAMLLGYVVTNFGTLFRMRLMIAVPIWTVVLALSESAWVSVPSGENQDGALGQAPPAAVSPHSQV